MIGSVALLQTNYVSAIPTHLLMNLRGKGNRTIRAKTQVVRKRGIKQITWRDRPSALYSSTKERTAVLHTCIGTPISVRMHEDNDV